MPPPTSAMCRPAMASTCARPASRSACFVLLGDAAALAGDQGRGDGAGASGQRRLDARGHGQAQILQPPAPSRSRKAGRPRADGSGMRLAIGKTDRADGVERRAARPKSAAPGSRGRAAVVQPRRQAEPLRRAGKRRARPRSATRTRRGAWIKRAGAHLVQHQPNPVFARLHRRRCGR